MNALRTLHEMPLEYQYRREFMRHLRIAYYWHSAKIYDVILQSLQSNVSLCYCIVEGDAVKHISTITCKAVCKVGERPADWWKVIKE